MTAFENLALRKLADKSEGTRVRKYDPDTGQPKLVNPETPGDDHEPWPLLGVELLDAPKKTRGPTSFVTAGQAEGWLELKGEKVVHKPGGPASDPWRVTHTFLHADALVFHCHEGDVHYKVTRQPDKYSGPENGKGTPTDVAGSPNTSVDWWYELERED